MDTRDQLDQLQQTADEAFRVDDTPIDWGVAIAGMVAVAVPIFVGLAIGRQHLGLLGALGGLNVALVVPGRRVGDRWTWGALAILGTIVGLTLAELAHPSIIASVALTFIWVTTWATLRVAGKHGGLAGFAVSAVFLLTSGLPPQPLGPSVIAIALGGLLGFAMMLTIGGRPSPEGVDPTWLGVGETLKLARARFLNRAPLRHHALRLGVATSAAVLGYRLLDLSYGYWVALTVLAILQPDPHGTRVRALQRSSGTMIGILIAAAFVYLTGDPWILAAAASLLALLLFAVRDSSYHLLVMLLTPTALLMVSTVSYSGIDIAGYRVLNTAIGILVALAASWLMWGHERIGPPPPAPKPG